MNYQEKLKTCLEKAKNNTKLKGYVLTIENMIKTNNPTILNKCWVDYFLKEKEV